MRRRTHLLLASLLLVPTACGGSDDEPTGSPESPGSESAEETPEAIPESTAEATAAADWLAGQLDDGVARNEDLGFDDYGLSIDIGLALDEVGGQDAAVAAVVDAVRTDQAAYTTFEDDVYAGATAKALMFLQTQDADPGDLQRQLEGLVGEDGRLADDAASGDDFANVVGQAYGARALVDAASEDAAAVASYLVDQQCADGFFRAAFAAPGADDQTCDGDPRAAPDADATALTLLLVGPVADEIEGGEAAMDAAADWLVAEQGADGGLAGAEGPGVNANTTGTAGWALGRWGEVDAAAAAAEVVVGLQVVDAPIDAGPQQDLGAIAYDRRALDGLAGRIGAPLLDQYRRASAQAAPALLWLGS